MNALEIRNLTKAYPGFRLDNLNLTLPSGCIMGLVGENGAGKSTAVKLILDMVRRDGGSVRILGSDSRKNICELKQDIGVVLDDVGIPGCLTAKQVGNIMRHTFKRWNETAYERYLEKLSIPSRKPFKDFSRGMRTKLGIAAALSHDPKLLILDEATSGLDPVVRDEVVDMIGEFTRDESRSVLISSHIVSDLEKVCDYIAFLHKGRLLLCEGKDALLERYGMLHCSAAQLAQLDPEAVKGKRASPYGVQALVLRDAVPAGFNVSPVGIEELFVFMVKGDL